MTNNHFIIFNLFFFILKSEIITCSKFICIIKFGIDVDQFQNVLYSLIRTSIKLSKSNNDRRKPTKINWRIFPTTK